MSLRLNELKSRYYTRLAVTNSSLCVQNREGSILENSSTGTMKRYIRIPYRGTIEKLFLVEHDGLIKS